VCPLIEESEKLEVALAEKEQLLIEAKELKNELVNLTSQHEYNLAHLKSVQEANQNLTTTHRYTEQLLSKIKAYRDNISSLVSRLEANEEISNSATVTTVASNNKCGSSEDSIESIEAELININKMFEHELRKFSTIENQSEKLFLELINLIVRFLITHAHPFPGLPPVSVTEDGSTINNLLNELSLATKKILNKKIRMN
jgi:hypothetical protein